MSELEVEQGWATTMGLSIVSASADQVIIDVEVGPRHLQGFGLVHGGVYSGLIESAASLGATIVAKARGQAPPVGLENHTTLVRSVIGGRIRTTATPITRGRTTHVWEATIRDEKDQIVATGRVRLLCVESTAPTR